MKTLTLGLVQQTCSTNREENLAKTEAGIRKAAAEGAKLVLLQELHTGPYFCQVESAAFFDLAEPIPGPTTDALSTLAKELDVVIVASVFERRAPGLYHNTAVVMDGAKGVVGTYRKMHIPDDPGYHEKYYFTPGDQGFEPIDTSVGRLGVLVCWDQWFPEAARLMALAGADMLLYPTAIGWDEKDEPAEQQRQFEAWQIVQRAHAIANNLPVAVCNRTGREPDPTGELGGILFWGGSFVAGNQGELLAQGPTHEESVVLATLDLDRTEHVRRNWPYLRDRRIDAYSDLLKRYRDGRDAPAEKPTGPGGS